MAKNISDEASDLLKKYGGTQQDTVRMVGKTVGSDNVVFEKKVIKTESCEGIRTLEIFSTRRCDSCGRVIDQKNFVSGVCTVCGEVVCSGGEQKSCVHYCRKCGVTLCRQDAKVYGNNGDEVYCKHHRYLYWLKLIFK